MSPIHIARPKNFGEINGHPRAFELVGNVWHGHVRGLKINNIILVLCTRIILLPSFVVYFFCICHSGSFPIIYVAGH